MLVLSRRLDEVVVIGEGVDAVELTVLEISRGKVRLGFSAPNHIAVDRLEVRRRRQREERNDGGADRQK